MSTAMDFHSQIASIMQVLANAAVAEICKVVYDGYAVVHLEMSRSQRDNDFLRRKMKLLELQIARYRAERVKGAEGSINGRLTGARFLNRRHKDSLAAPSLQGRMKFLNRGPGAQHSVQKTQPINLDQDPDQEVVTTTKTESAEPEEEEERKLLVVKVEGAMETRTTNHEVAVNTCISSRGNADTATLLPAAWKGTSQCSRHSETEVSGSDIITFVVSRTAETDSNSRDTTQSSQVVLIRSDVRAGDSEPSNSVSDITLRSEAVPVSCDGVMDDRKHNKDALDSSKSPLSEVIVIDGGWTSDKEEKEWTDVDQTKREAGMKERLKKTTLPMCAWLDSAGHRTVQVMSSVQTGSISPHDDPPGTSSSGTTPCISFSSNAHNVALHHPVSHTHHSHHKPFSSSFHLAFYHAVTKERPYGCTSCTKRFFLESDLQKHMARHTREKPYTCLLCSKSFVCQSQLDIHRNVHTGERPFRCSICSRRFSHPSNLKRHQKIHH